jgi:serine/threonine protein phosphatase PrpC
VCLTPRRGGRLILGTDGLWNLVDADDLATRVVSMRGARPMTVARTLTEQAVQAGGHDNITVAVVDVSSTTASREE